MCVRHTQNTGSFEAHSAYMHQMCVYIEFLCMLWGIDSHSNTYCVVYTNVRYVLLCVASAHIFSMNGQHAHKLSHNTIVFVHGYFGFLSGSHHWIQSVRTHAHTTQSNAWQLYTHTNASTITTLQLSQHIHTVILMRVYMCVSRWDVKFCRPNVHAHTFKFNVFHFGSSHTNEYSILCSF